MYKILKPILSPILPKERRVSSPIPSPNPMFTDKIRVSIPSNRGDEKVHDVNMFMNDSPLGAVTPNFYLYSSNFRLKSR